MRYHHRHEGEAVSREEMQIRLETRDPLVLKTGWYLLSDHTVIIKNYARSRSGERLYLRNNVWDILMPAAGIAILAFAFLCFANPGLFDTVLHILGPVGIGGIIAALIGVGLYFNRRNPHDRIVIDRSVPALWKERTASGKVPHSKKPIGYRSLKQLHAIQILGGLRPKTAELPASSIHEVNLVFNNGERAFLTAYSDHRTAVMDARYISRFLKVAFWDGHLHPTPPAKPFPNLGKPFDFIFGIFRLYYSLKILGILLLLFLAFILPLFFK